MVGKGFMVQLEGRNLRQALYKTGRGDKQIQLCIFSKENQFILNHSSCDFWRCFSSVNELQIIIADLIHM